MSLEYMAPERAYQEAGERLCNDRLQTRVNEFLGGIWPGGVETADKPRAVFAPYLAKGSVVEVEFLKVASEAGFDTMVATYRDAEYVTANPGIVDCYRAPLIESSGLRSRTWIVPMEERRGSVGVAQTVYEDLSILDYWKGIRRAVLENAGLPSDDLTVDFGGWYRMQAARFGWQGERSRSPFYYKALMGLYASGRAVLFDTPPTRFAPRIMEPAADYAAEALGSTPLMTCELQPDKRDWTDVSFLSSAQLASLKQTGTVQ